MSRQDPSTKDFGIARDELFSHIHRCGVLKATPEQQEEWMDDTVEFIAERYPALSREQVGELRTIGMRFCRPVIDNAVGDETEAEATDETTDEVKEDAAEAAAA